MNRPLKLLLDEHIWEDLANTLTQRGYDVTHINHTEYRGIHDEPLLVFATAQGRAILTFNVKHFAPLVVRWAQEGRQHAGVIFSKQLPPSDLIKRLEALLSSLSSDDLFNSARWL